VLKPIHAFLRQRDRTANRGHTLAAKVMTARATVFSQSNGIS